jgi:subtilisin family serine protease
MSRTLPSEPESDAMNRSSLVQRPLALALTAAFATLVAMSDASAQAGARKTVNTLDDLPRFTYPVAGTATDLVKADDATFNAFAAKVRADVDGTLAQYDIQDHGEVRSLLATRLALQMLSGTEDQAALDTIAQIRALEDKPDAKLLSGVSSEALVKAHMATGQYAGAEFERVYAKAYADALAPLPWAVVGNRVKEAKSRAQIVSESVVLGSIQGNIEPAVTRSHEVSSDMARSLVSARFALKQVIPHKDATVALLSADVAAHDVQKADIWAARDVTLTAGDKLTPVTVAIWDSGSDLALFPGKVYTDKHPRAGTDPHGLAFDLQSRVTHGMLMPLTPAQARRYPGMRDNLKGLSDLQLSIDSPEADGLKKQLAAMSPTQASAFFEELSLYGNYSHGTHVTGIAARGNPAIRLAYSRLTFDYRHVPQAPTETLTRAGAASYKASVAWFRAHGVRVVNMSWGGNPSAYESDLEKNGIGKDAADRKQIARKLFTIDHDGLYEAMKSAPDVLFICAAGNADANSSFDESIPASLKLPNLLTVGAVDQAGDEASFTSYGDTVLVDANGYQVESTLPGGALVRFSGTSMASPNATNLAAKLIALDPKLTPQQVIKLMVDGATPSEDGRRHNLNPKESVALLKKL